MSAIEPKRACQQIFGGLANLAGCCLGTTVLVILSTRAASCDLLSTDNLC